MVQCFFAVIVTSVSQFSHVCFVTLKLKAYLWLKYDGQELIDQLISSGFYSNKTLLSFKNNSVEIVVFLKSIQNLNILGKQPGEQTL